VHLASGADTTLGRAVRAADPCDGRSGVRALPDALEAFTARVALARTAEAALDLQYYIWRADTTGILLLEEIRRAAARGVRVRLLLDDNGIAGMDPLLAALDACAGVEVRLFNPYPQRRFKPLGYLFDFARLNRRMHNKAWIADRQAAIVGGRNVGDVCFGADPALAFADLDALVAGPVAADIAAAFDAYWNSPLARPVSRLVKGGAKAAAALTSRIAEVAAAPQTARYVDALRDTGLAARMSAGTLALEWVAIRLVVDPPAKAEGRVEPSEWMAADLTAALGRAERLVDLVSPYFVPGARGTAALSRYRESGVRLRVLTNSLAATDVAAVHAGYARRRLDLLRAGVSLYEFKPERGAAPGRGWGVVGSSAASLHGKTFALDRRRAYVGSFNVDPRSLSLNTEMGLVIESPGLATTISDAIDRWLPANAYELRLGKGGRVEWIERTGAGEVVYDEEAHASRGRRLLVWLLERLPIEWLL
jgi:putative cardiolipin synthase